MLDMIDTPPHKIVFLGPGCSVATTPVAEAAPYWEAVQVSFIKRVKVKFVSRSQGPTSYTKTSIGVIIHRQV